MSAGLGSSASLSVALAAVMLHSKSPETSPDLEAICQAGFMGEKMIHGNPSGIDNTIVTYGGMISYVAGETTHIENTPSLPLLIVETGVPRQTKAMVEKVCTLSEQFPTIANQIFDAID